MTIHNWDSLDVTVIKMFYAGNSYKEIANAVGVSESGLKSHIYSIRYRKRLDFGARRTAMEHRHKVHDWDKVDAEVVRFLGENKSINEIADMLGVPYSTLYGRINRETRKVYQKKYYLGRSGEWCKHVKRIPTVKDCTGCTRETCVLDERNAE